MTNHPHSPIRLLCAILLVLPITGVAAEKGENDTKREEEVKEVLVKFERYGGFAGFHDNLTIYSDFTFFLDTPPHVNHHFKGSLSIEHQKELTKLLKTYGEFLEEKSDGPRVADGMRTRIEINGFAEDADAKGDERNLTRLLREITLAARKSERVPTR